MPPESEAVSALPARDAARVLEVAHDHLYYRYQTGIAPRADSLPRARAILVARSRIDTGAGSPPVARPEVPPHAGHPTLRLAAGGVWEDDGFTLGLRRRPLAAVFGDDAGGLGYYVEGGETRRVDLALQAYF